MATMEEWSLSDDQRADTIERIKMNMYSMYFFSNETDPTVLDMGSIAAVIEKKAYTVAKVEAKTTTGFRPHHETLKVFEIHYTYVGLLCVMHSCATCCTHAGIC